MLGSLRARLIISFALVVGLAVFLAGAGSLFLLRDKQEETARERYGRLAEPLNDRFARLASTGQTLDQLKGFLDQRAEDSDVRILLLDQDLSIVYDTQGNTLFGKYVLGFETSRVKTEVSRGTSFKWVDYQAPKESLTLFAAPVTPDDSVFAAPEYEAVIAIPHDQLASAWLELVPRLAIAGAIALIVSFIVSYFISRSISGPLRRITQASKQMAQGNYDVHIPIGGEDEVGRLAEAFNQMAKEVSTSQTMMKDLLANVSHELKTPLTSIQGFSQAIIDGVVTDDHDVKEYSRTIHEESNRMRELVDDLLLLSQIESGQATMDHQHVELKPLLERMVERFQWSMRDAGIESGLRVEPMPAVHGDERRLEQVFSNLMQNAVRHTPRGGIITVSAHVLAGGHISVGVHNTGSVIPDEDLPRVFERFFQVDRARARKGGSSGLGLSIVAEIVEAHGGTVRAISSAIGGTEFIVILPNPATSEVRNGRVMEIEEARPKRSRNGRNGIEPDRKQQAAQT
jgi:signal transduction histidine kinase